MLESVKIARRQSEIRQALAGLVGKEKPTEDETRSMETMDAEYRQNETRYRAALVAEDTERRDAKDDLENRSDDQWREIVDRFELRQVALALDEGKKLEGATAEVVEEMRSSGGYRGIPIPWQALELERRAGETIAATVADPIRTMPYLDRLFPDSVSARMQAQLVNIDSGAVEWPVVTSNVTAGWADGELANVSGPTTFTTVDKALKPEHNLGVQMRISRKALKQSDALEQAVRRDMNGAIGAALDKAVFLGTGANGQPLGVITGAATYGITSTDDPGTLASWGAFRAGIARFMTANAAGSPNAVRMLIRPELWSVLDGALISGTGISEWDRLVRNVSADHITMSANALAAPSGTPLVTQALLTTAAGGVPPIFVGTWGGIDLIRDPFTDAQSGGLRLTALITADVTVARPAQLELITGIELE